MKIYPKVPVNVFDREQLVEHFRSISFKVENKRLDQQDLDFIESQCTSLLNKIICMKGNSRE